MSRVLSNLVARSLGAVPSFRPRTPSLFEPAHHVQVATDPALHRPMHRDPWEIEETGAVADHGEMAPATTQNSGPVQPQACTELHPPGLEAPYPRSYRLDSILVKDAPATSGAREQTSLSHHTETAPARLPWITPLQSQNTGDSGNPAHLPMNAESFSAVVPRPPKPDVMKSPAIPVADRSAGHRLTGEEERHEPSPATFTPDRQEKPGAPSLAVRNRLLPREHPSGVHDVEPVVHVTIGRIEIRAERETVVAGRRSERAPVMGLEEYLRRKNTRGRE
jgi:hypothetical protein